MPNEFTSMMDTSWDTANTVFGDEITLLGQTYAAIIHGFDQQTMAGLVGGRTKQISGSVIMQTSAWIESGATQGKTIVLPTLPGVTVRITNEPARNRATVKLDVVATVSN